MSKMEVTREEFMNMMENNYKHTAEAKIKSWGIERCVECPNCEFTGDDPYMLWEFPHCTKISTRGVRCISRTAKVYGCPSNCPTLSEADKRNFQLNVLHSKLDKKMNDLEKLNETIEKLTKEIASLESKDTEEDE